MQPRSRLTAFARMANDHPSLADVETVHSLQVACTAARRAHVQTNEPQAGRAGTAPRMHQNLRTGRCGSVPAANASIDAARVATARRNTNTVRWILEL